MSGTRRRPYGTGSLQLISGAWYGLWRDPTGRRVKRRIGPARTPSLSNGLTRAAAEERLRALREAEDAVVPATDAGRVTLDVAGEALCLSLKIKQRKKSHQMTVASDLRNHIAPFFGSKSLDKIKPDDIERYVGVKQAEGLAIKTIRNHINTMHSVFDIGVRRGWCVANPVKSADRPTIKRNETRLRFLDQPALEKLLATPFPDDAFGRIEPILYLTAAMSGLRQGELLGLRWRDVDFEARRLRVVSPFVRGEFADPKSVGSARSVPMADRIAEALTQLQADTLFPRPQDLVFAHPDTGRPLDRSKLIRRFKEAVSRADVNTVTFHELRHTFGTRMAAAGVPIRAIQQWLGHADIKTTQIYAHYQRTEHEVDVVNQAFL